MPTRDRSKASQRTPYLVKYAALLSSVALLAGGVQPAVADQHPTEVPAEASSEASSGTVLFPGNDGKQHEVSFDSKSFMIDGERLNVWSGEIHYWRLPSPEHWRDVFQKMRAAGFNAVSLYFFWGYHSSVPGEYDFGGVKDIDKLLTMAAEEGLYVIARPGPYVNAEISMGGLPAYMANKEAALRTAAPEVLEPSKEWLGEVNKHIKNHLITEGKGSVILYQVENEMLAENAPRAAFMKELTTFVRNDGINVPVFHNDYNMGGRFVPGSDGPGGDVGLDFYAYDSYPLGFNCGAARNRINDTEQSFRRIAPDTPQFITEAQGGAFTPWGASFNTDQCAEYVDESFIRQWGANNIGNGVNAFNYYMSFGGTNWGWTGSPSSGFTSYDYGAGITEDRGLTPKHSVQKEIGYFIDSVPQLTSMDPVVAPEVTVEGDVDVNVYQRVAAEDKDSSVTGVGTRYLGFRLADSNDTTQTRFTVPLALGGDEIIKPKEYTTDDSDRSVISYTGNWTTASGQSWTAANYQDTETFSDRAGDSLEYRFTGSGIRVISPQSINHGYADVFLDGEKVGEMNTYAGAQNPTAQYVSFEQRNLDPSVEHTLKIVVRGTAEAGSQGTFVSVDAFDVLTNDDGGGTATEPQVQFERVPQKAGTFLDLHGRDALMLAADMKIGSHDLYYSTSQIVANEPIADGRLLVLSGIADDDGETVLRYDAEPKVETLAGAPVEQTWDAETSTLRLNYTHEAGTVVRITADGAEPLILELANRESMQKSWKVSGQRDGANATVFVTGADLVRTVRFDGATAHFTGSMSEDSTLAFRLPEGITSLTWNGEELAHDAGVAGHSVTAAVPGPAAVPVPELSWRTAEGAPEAQPDFDDSGWKVITENNAANRRQGPGSNQGVVLDSNFHHFFEGDVWYRATYTASSADGTISLQGNGGNAGNMLVWANGVYLGAPDANGSWKNLALPAGTVKAGEEVTVSALVRNQGQNLDWSDNGLSKQNRGLYDAKLTNDGPVTWRIQGARDVDRPVDLARTMYNNGGLYGERAGWHLPGYPDADWAAAETFTATKAGVSWFRSSLELDVPAGQDTSYALKINSPLFEAGRKDHSRTVMFVNGWNIGTYVGDVGPQTHFTIPSGFLNMDGTNEIAIALTAESAGMGPASIELVETGSVTGGVPHVQNEAPRFPEMDIDAEAVSIRGTAGSPVSMNLDGGALPVLAGGTITAFSVDWGDGSPVESYVAGEQPAHVYAKPRHYRATVTMHDAVSNGALATDTVSFRINNSGKSQ